MNDHAMTEDQAHKYSRWLTFWKLAWITSLGTIIYAFITPTLGRDWLWIFAAFVVSFFGGGIFKGFADDVAMNRNDTILALAFIALLNAKYILVGIMALIIVAITGV